MAVKHAVRYCSVAPAGDIVDLRYVFSRRSPENDISAAQVVTGIVSEEAVYKFRKFRKQVPQCLISLQNVNDVTKRSRSTGELCLLKQVVKHTRPTVQFQPVTIYSHHQKVTDDTDIGRCVRSSQSAFYIREKFPRIRCKSAVEGS